MFVFDMLVLTIPGGRGRSKRMVVTGGWVGREGIFAGREDCPHLRIEIWGTGFGGGLQGCGAWYGGRMWWS
jgi:hypothetical protein